ncbi:Pre-mRNA-splicing factor of RES complex-domain-containing protein [Amylostereum chailletii]|nr:Pre-mRNA-splicing factor of RES complex-domain-containing protein [Amylostereum chailletii]
MTSMKSYLAEKYMSGPKADAILARTAPKKKKKRKADSVAGPSGFGIQDDDAGWGAANADEVEDEAADAVVAEDRAFKKRRVNGSTASTWTTIREPTPPPAPDEQPQIVDAPQPFKGGLLTSKELRSKLPSARVEREELSREEHLAAQETVYRDASGRKLDMKAERVEAARKKREREEKEAQKMEWGKGLVQRDQEEERKKKEASLRGKDFVRYADDAELNRDQKEQERWNDPAAAFLTVRRLYASACSVLTCSPLTQKKRTKGPRKPEYNGPPPPPNRFGIRPGYRWDGVDRGNGFEAKLFQRQNERKRTAQASHNWSVDEM